MSALAFLIFAAIAAAAIGFAVLPLLVRRNKANALLAGAIAAFMLAIGAGLYLWQGQPQLAVRSLTGPQQNDIPSLIAALSVKVRERPNDITGWILLGRGYLTLNDPGDAAKAFGEAIAVANAQHRRDAALYSAYGEALTRASAGAVTPDAEAAFRTALAIDPKDFASRYYLGFAYAERAQAQQALAMWNALLADAPANAPWRRELIDRMAMLRATSGGAAPDISAMVEGLAARLKSKPKDLAGWQRLIRAYSVLGERDKANSALATARENFRNNASAMAALTAEEKFLALRK